MRFSQSTHLQMYLYLESLGLVNLFLRTGQSILAELIVLVNSFILNNFTQKVNVPSRISGCDSYSPTLLLNLFIFSDPNISFILAFLPLVSSDHCIVSVSIDFLSKSNRDVPFNAQIIIIFVFAGTVFMIICEIIHWRVSLSWCFCCCYLTLWVGPGLN